MILDKHLQRLPVKIKTMDGEDASKDIWVGYWTIEGREMIVCEGTLSEVKKFAKDNGLLGISL